MNAETSDIARTVLRRLGEIVLVVFVPRSGRRRHGALALPDRALLLADGRCVAWYDDGRPFIVHPSIVDLAMMHGAEEILPHAAA